MILLIWGYYYYEGYNNKMVYLDFSTKFGYSLLLSFAAFDLLVRLFLCNLCIDYSSCVLMAHDFWETIEVCVLCRLMQNCILWGELHYFQMNLTRTSFAQSTIPWSLNAECCCNIPVFTHFGCSYKSLKSWSIIYICMRFYCIIVTYF